MSQSLSPAHISPRATTARGTGIGGLIVAVLLHAALIAVTLLTWEHKLDIVDQSPPNVPVDLVTLSDRTNVTPVAEKKAPEPTPEPPQPAVQPAPEPAPPPPQAAEPLPEPKPAPVVKAEPPPKPEPAPKPAPVKPKPDVKKKTASDDLNALLSSLTAPPPKAGKSTKTNDRPRQGIGDMNMMTADLASMLKSEMSPCWTSPPVGAPHPERLIPSFRIQLNRDGTVARQPQLAAESAAAAAADPFMRAAVEAARRAILTCGPYKLPADRYEQWKDATISFDPREMVQ